MSLNYLGISPSITTTPFSGFGTQTAIGGGPIVQPTPPAVTFATLPDVAVVPQQPNHAVHYDASLARWVQAPQLSVDTVTKNVNIVSTGSVLVDTVGGQTYDSEATISLNGQAGATLESTAGNVLISSSVGVVNIDAVAGVATFKGNAGTVLATSASTFHDISTAVETAAAYAGRIGARDEAIPNVKYVNDTSAIPTNLVYRDATNSTDVNIGSTVPGDFVALSTAHFGTAFVNDSTGETRINGTKTIMTADTDDVELTSATADVVLQGVDVTMGAPFGTPVLTVKSGTTDIEAVTGYLAPSATSLMTRELVENIASGYVKTDGSNTGALTIGNTTPDNIQFSRNGATSFLEATGTITYLRGDDTIITADTALQLTSQGSIELTATTSGQNTNITYDTLNLATTAGTEANSTAGVFNVNSNTVKLGGTAYSTPHLLTVDRATSDIKAETGYLAPNPESLMTRELVEDLGTKADPYLNSLGTTFEHPKSVGFQGTGISDYLNLTIDSTFNDTSPVAGQWYNGTYLMTPVAGSAFAKGDNWTAGAVQASKVVIRYLTGNGSQVVYGVMSATNTALTRYLNYNTASQLPAMFVSDIGQSMPVSISFYGAYDVDADVGTVPKLNRVLNWQIDDVDSFERVEINLENVVSWTPYGLPTITTQPTVLRINGSGTSGTGVYLAVTNGSQNELNVIWTRTAAGTGGQGVLNFNVAANWYNKFFFVRTRVSNAVSLPADISYTVSSLTNIVFKNISTAVPAIVTTFTQANIDSRLIIGEITTNSSVASFNLVLADTRLGITGPSVPYEYAVPSGYADVSTEISAAITAATKSPTAACFWTLNTTAENGGAAIATAASIKLSAAATTAVAVSSEWTHTTPNRLTYTGLVSPAIFEISYGVSTFVGDNDRSFRFSVRTDGTTEIPQSKSINVSRNTLAGADDSSKTFFATLTTGQFIEVWATNLAANTELTVAEYYMQAKFIRPV